MQSTNSDFNPNNLFVTQTWTKIENMFLYGSGTYTVGVTGGEEKHKLTIAEMPSHRHLTIAYSSSGNDYSYTDLELSHNFTQTMRGWSDYVGASGGDGTHNNMPPYKVVNIWERIA